MTVQLAPTPVFKAFDNNGNPLANGQLLTLIAGTSTPQATWVDSTQTTQNTNPVILNARGEASVWLDQTLTYKLTLKDSLGNQIWSIDQISGGYLTASLLASILTPDYVGAILYPQTTQEIAVSALPVNFQYPPGYVDRYGNNTVPGTSDMTAAFQAAINQARAGGTDVVWGSTGIYNLTAPLDCTFAGAGAQYGINFRQISTPSVNYQPTARCGILVTHSAYTVFDLTGCNGFTFYDLSLITATGSSPMTCFLTARNSTGGSNSIAGRFSNTHVNGSFSTALLYNYASEDGVYSANNWTNASSAAGAKLIVLTSLNNILPGNGPGSIGMASNFVTIATGGQSCIDHEFMGGQYAMTNASATSDVWYLDACAHLKVFGAWGAANAARSYFYCDLTNGPAAYTKIVSFQGEVGAAPNYGVLIPNASGTPSAWYLRDVFWQVNTASVAASGATPIVDNFRITGLAEFATKGIIIPGTLQNSHIEYAGTVTVSGTATKNFIIGSKASITLPGGVGNNVILDIITASIVVGGSLSMNGNSAPGTLNGWGTPTAGAVINNFPGSGATLSQCGQAITEIIITLKAFGLFGA